MIARRAHTLSLIALAGLAAGCASSADRCYVTLNGAGAPTAEACESGRQLIVRPITETNAAYYVPPYVIGALHFEGYLDTLAERDPWIGPDSLATANASEAEETLSETDLASETMVEDDVAALIAADALASAANGEAGKPATLWDLIFGGVAEPVADHWRAGGLDLRHPTDAGASADPDMSPALLPDAGAVDVPLVSYGPSNEDHALIEAQGLSATGEIATDRAADAQGTVAGFAIGDAETTPREPMSSATTDLPAAKTGRLVRSEPLQAAIDVDAVLAMRLPTPRRIDGEVRYRRPFMEWAFARPWSRPVIR